MSGRLPKPLRRRVASEQGPAHIPYWNPVLQEDYCHADGEPWPCLHYRQNVPAKCKCSHVKHAGQCWSRSCGCTTYRPDDVGAAMDRHPAGKAIPEHLRTDDINDYLRQKGEL